MYGVTTYVSCFPCQKSTKGQESPFHHVYSPTKLGRIFGVASVYIGSDLFVVTNSVKLE